MRALPREILHGVVPTRLSRTRQVASQGPSVGSAGGPSATARPSRVLIAGAVAGIHRHRASYSNVMGRTGVTPGAAAARRGVSRGTVLATKAARELSAAQ